MIKVHKISPEPNDSVIKLNVNVMMKTSVQLNMTAIADATLFTSDANNSPIIIHGIGPNLHVILRVQIFV